MVPAIISIILIAIVVFNIYNLTKKKGNTCNCAYCSKNKYCCNSKKTDTL